MDVEDAIKEIAAKHGIAIGRDDPILILVTLIQMFSKELSVSQSQILDGFQSEIEQASSRWEESSKAQASKILNAALTASKETMRTEMSAGAHAVVDIMKNEIIDKWTQNLTAPKDVKRIAWLNIFAAGMAFLASVLACMALLLH